MHRLRDLGVALSIDDFGTGYSSLSRLAQFPIQLLKIPKTFVDPLAGDEADTSFIDAILRLADSLGIVTVAEGIEHAAQGAGSANSAASSARASSSASRSVPTMRSGSSRRRPRSPSPRASPPRFGSPPLPDRA